jgi:acetolactate synthase-1/2/3 large subunit
MGCEGVRVTEPQALRPALQAALKTRIPTVIDVRTSMDVSFRDVTSPLASAARRG